MTTSYLNTGTPGDILTDNSGANLLTDFVSGGVPLFLILQLMLNQQPSMLMQSEAAPPTEPPPTPLTPRRRR